MKPNAAPFLLACVLALSGAAAWAQLPAVNLTVMLRQVEDGGTGYAVGTRPQTPLLEPQQLQVRNGERAQWQFEQAIPLQWVKSVSAPSRLSGASVQQGLTWLQAGQGLVVQPRWPGGSQPVQVQIEVRSAAVQARPGSELPVQARSELVSTLALPLGEWVTIASSGGVAQPGTYRSEGAARTRRLLQLRITAP